MITLRKASKRINKRRSITRGRENGEKEKKKKKVYVYRRKKRTHKSNVVPIASPTTRSFVWVDMKLSSAHGSAIIRARINL